MAKAYLYFGFTICLIFAYATHKGWPVSESIQSGKWSPAGQSSVYHK